MVGATLGPDVCELLGVGLQGLRNRECDCRCFLRYLFGTNLSYMTCRNSFVRPKTIQIARPGVTPYMYPVMLDEARAGLRSGSSACVSRATSSFWGRCVTRLANMNKLDTYY